MSALEKITDWLKLGNKIVIPKTYASCVYDSDGNSEETRLSNLQQQIDAGGGSSGYAGFRTYGGVGIGGVATHYDLERAPKQPTS